MKTIRIGTRTSALARKQTELVMEIIREQYQDIAFEVIPLKTKGDQMLQTSLAEFGGKGAFVTEFEEALLDGRIDLAVHSAKDLPVELGEGLDLWMTLQRADARDVLLTRKNETREPDQKYPMHIGTSSPRRQLQIEQLFPCKCSLLRGNVPTRIEKLRQGQYDGILLAAAGFKRLGLDQEEDIEYRYLSTEEMIPAGGQGIIAVEGRKDHEYRELFSTLGDSAAKMELEVERYILERLQAGCHEPVGVFSKITDRITDSITDPIEGLSLDQGDMEKSGQIELWLLLERNGHPQKGYIAGAVEERFLLADQLIREVRTDAEE